MKFNLRSGLLGSAAFLFLFAFSACSKKISFQTSSIVPAAEGTVKIKNDKNKNYVIDLNVIRLAEPKRLSSCQKHLCGLDGNRQV